jgi:hypothetical protein
MEAFMSFNPLAWARSKLDSLLHGNEAVDKGFIGVLHKAAQQIGSSEGRQYLVISNKALGLSSNNSETASLEELTKFVNSKLKGLTEQEATSVNADFGKIKAEYLRQSGNSSNALHQIERALVADFLDINDIQSTRKVSNTWKADIDKETRRLMNTQMKTMAFGSEKWSTYFGNVSEPFPPPAELLKLMNTQCPFWPDKKVFETHMAYLVPASIEIKTVKEGDPPVKINLSFKEWGEMVKKPISGHPTKYEYVWQQILTDHGDVHVTKPYWALMTRDVIPGSRNKTYPEQQKHVEEMGYEVPDILSAAIGIQQEYVSTGKILYGRSTPENPNQWTYTRCKEQSGGFQTIVGGLAASGLDVDYYCDDYVSAHIGVAGLRKFFLGS